MRIASTFAAALLLAPSLAGAQGLVARVPGLGPTSFTITNTTLLRYRGQNFDTNLHDDSFFSLTERLDVAAQSAPWRLYARVDGFVPWNHDTTCDSATASLCYLHSNFRPGDTLLPERLSLRYQREGITVEFGDYYQVFGRGVALAFRKVDPIGLDTTLRGARAEYERGRFTGRVFAGRSNPQNLDPISLSIFDDPRDVLAGGAVEVRLGADEDIALSAHVVHTDFERLADSGRQDDVDVAGWRFEVPSLLDGALSLYGEIDVLRRVSHHTERDGRVTGEDRVTNGRAAYAQAQLNAGRWTVLAEWKDYSHYLLAPTEASNSAPRDVARVYSSAPSLERDDQRIFTNANTRGGRVRVDYAMSSAPWIFTLNSVFYGWADTADVRGNLLDPWDSEHGYLTSHTYFSVRRRPRTNQGADAGAPGGAAIPTGGGLGVASASRVQRGEYNLAASIGYRREFHAGTQRTTGTAQPEWEAGDVKHESIQADLDVAFPVGSNDSLELRIDHRFERNYVFDRLTGFDLDQILAGARGGVALSWSHGLPLVVSAMLRWDNTNRAVGSATLDNNAFGTLTPPQLPTLYPAAEVRWNFTISNFIRVFAGMTPGGRVCSGGVCRDVPLFQGAVAELVLRI